MRRRIFIVILAVVGGLLFGATNQARAEPIVALTTQNLLIRFDSTTPGMIIGSASVTGLQVGESLVGIDFRPANGQLYGLGSNSRLYTINLMTGVATFASALSTPLVNATSFGIDFNPVVDRLRVVGSDNRINPAINQNLRIDVDTGMVVVDGRLTPVMVVSPLDPNIGAAAYSNNFAGATSTMLYDIDFFRDRLVIQNPPNDGTLERVGELSPLMPPMGADVTNEMVAFDISGVSGIAYASLTSPTTNFSALYAINLNTGLATLVGPIGSGVTIRGLAAPIGTPVPEPATMLLLGAGLAGVAAKVRARRKSCPGEES